MVAAASESKRFRRLEQVYRTIWVAFPIYVAYHVWQVVSLPERLADLDPALKACMEKLPMVTSFSLPGRIVYWLAFASEMAIYMLLLIMAHRVLARCAQGRIFFPDLVGALRVIALIITALPVYDLILQNVLLVALAALGDMAYVAPSFDLDVTVLGVGLLMLTVTAAMGEAVRLREDSELTI